MLGWFPMITNDFSTYKRIFLRQDKSLRDHGARRASSRRRMGLAGLRVSLGLKGRVGRQARRVCSELAGAARDWGVRQLVGSLAMGPVSVGGRRSFGILGGRR